MATATVQKRPRPHHQRTQLVTKHQETVLALWFGAIWLTILGAMWLVLGTLLAQLLVWWTHLAARTATAHDEGAADEPVPTA